MNKLAIVGFSIIVARLIYSELITGIYEDSGLAALRIQYTLNSFDYVLWAIVFCICLNHVSVCYIPLMKCSIAFFLSMSILSLYVWLPATIRTQIKDVSNPFYAVWWALSIAMAVYYFFCRKGRLIA